MNLEFVVVSAVMGFDKQMPWLKLKPSVIEYQDHRHHDTEHNQIELPYLENAHMF